MKKELLISVIIPVYNSLKLIDRCIDSLTNQTSNNFEAVFVDDCSVDGSYDYLCKKLSSCKFKYKVLKNEENSGPGVTRNNGIKNSNGNYVTFLDSDDYVSDSFIKYLLDIIVKQNYDVVIFDYNMIHKNGTKNIRNGLPLDEGEVKALDALALSNGMCWGKLYKRNIIFDNNVFFPNLIRSEDLAFCKVFISKSKKIYYMKKSIYNYTINDNSIMRTNNTLDINNNIKAFEFIEKNVGKNEAVEMIFIREYLYLIVQIMTIKKYKTKQIKEFINKSIKRYENWKKNKYLKFQPFYVKVLLKFIKYKMIFPLRMIFKLKG